MRKLLILLLLPFFALSCNRSGMGIFYSISEEQPLSDTELDNSLSVTGMVRAGDEYLMSAGTLYTRATTDGVWANADSMPLDVCVSLVLFGTNVYGLFADTAGTVTGLYSSPTGTITWSEISVSTNRLSALTATASALYITETVDAATYITRESQDGLDFSTVLSLTGQYASVTDSALFAGSTWLMSGTNIYKGSVGLSLSYSKLSSTPVTAFGYGGLFSSDLLSALFVSNTEGAVFATSDGATWHTATVVDSSDNPVPLYDMAEIAVAGTPVILLGAKNGYYDIIFEGGAFSSSFVPVVPGSEASGSYSSSDTNFLKVDLRSSVVRFFFVDTVDTATSTVFAGTSGNGLWINPISGSEPSSLIRKWDRQ